MKFILIISALILFSACKKTQPPAIEESVTTEMENGLPAETNSINGYLYAYQGQTNNTMKCYAFFSEPSASLLAMLDHRTGTMPQDFEINPNVDVGKIHFDAYACSAINSKPSFWYHREYLQYKDTVPVWQTEGNRSFKAFVQQINRGFPVITADSIAAIGVNKTTGTVYDISSFARNFDSLIISVTDGFPNTHLIQKRIDGKTKTVTFLPEEFKTFYPGPTDGYLTIYAFNYSNRTIENKKYVFELAKTVFYYIIIND